MFGTLVREVNIPAMIEGEGDRYLDPDLELATAGISSL